MDDETRNNLENVGKHTPRYLFRAWSDSPSRYSGGFEGLNTTDAITPLAFHRRKGRASVYDMAKQEFTEMALNHLHTKKHGFETELSSWAASLSFVMESAGYAGEPGAHVSVVDTKNLPNAIFYVPSLDFLDHDMAYYPHGYLAHGVIGGEFIRSAPLRTLTSLDAAIVPYAYTHSFATLPPIDITTVRHARRFGEKFGHGFTLPVMLAALSRGRRHPHDFKNGDEELQIVLDGTSDLPVPEWWKDDTIMQDIVKVYRWPDVGYMIKLMRALAEHSAKGRKRTAHLIEKAQSAEEQPEQQNVNHDRPKKMKARSSQDEETNVAAKTRTDRVKKSLEIDMNHAPGSGWLTEMDLDPPAPESARLRKRKASSTLIKEEAKPTRMLEREMKKLEVDAYPDLITPAAPGKRLRSKK